MPRKPGRKRIARGETPAVDAAEAFLRQELKARAHVPGRRLPTIRQLASASSYSYQSVWRAVQRLAEAGLLFPVRGGGLCLAPRKRSGSRAAAQQALRKWERLAGAIEADLFEGDFSASRELPSVKELAGRYGADFRTVKRALDGLVDDKVLQPHKRSYRIVRRENRRGKSALLFVTAHQLAEFSMRDFAIFSLGEFVRFLETECGKRNLRFMPVSLPDNEATVKRIIRNEPVVGCILPEPFASDMLTTLFADLRTRIMIFDNINRFRLAELPDFQTDRRAFSFQLDEYAIGREVGHFLYSLGHRMVAFIAPFRAEGFVPRRFGGIHDVYRAMGAPSRTMLFAARTHPAEQVSVSIQLEHDVEVLLSLNIPSRREAMSSTARRIYLRRLREGLSPVFEQILARLDATAWVCVNDDVAIQALHFLRDKGVRVPEELSVIGFDNTEAALYNRLTSYDFDISGIALKMLNLILRPVARGKTAAADRVITSTGTIVQRESTASTGSAIRAQCTTVACGSAASRLSPSLRSGDRTT